MRNPQRVPRLPRSGSGGLSPPSPTRSMRHPQTVPRLPRPWTPGWCPGHYRAMTRRDFGKGLAAAGVATAVIRARIAGANDRIGVGLVGHGNKGQALWRSFRLDPEESPVAL